ncbi:MFS transporter [Chryseolinea sp. T2]|uniref:MFS transporter n=1 Tax=Chryseolinea sp. T2 TaxID=3129255 RepID=UPI00307822E9
MKKSLFALLLGGLGIGTTEFVMMGLLPVIAQNFGISIPQTGHFISAYALGVVIGAPMLVIFSGGIPPKRLLIMLMIMFTVFNALSGLATGYYSLLALRLLSGLPHGAFFGVGAVVASRLADKGKEAQAVSMMFAGLTIANLAGVPLGTFLGSHVSWRYTFMLIGVIGLATVLSLQLWMPKLSAARKENLAQQFNFFKSPEAWLIIATIAIGTGGLFCWISYISPLLTEVSGFSADSVPYILAFAGLGMCAGNLIGGRLADRFSPARTAFALLIAMSFSLTLVAMTAEYKVLSLAMTFITGALAFSLAPPIQMLMIQSARGSEMFAAAVAQACFNIGNALGAYLGGLPIDAGFSYTSAEWVGVGMALTGAMTAAALLQYRKRDMEIVPS